MINIEEIKRFWENGGKISINKKITMEYNSNNNILIFNSKGFIKKNERENIIKKINQILSFKNSKNKKIMLLSNYCALHGNTFTLCVSIFYFDKKYNWQKIDVESGIMNFTDLKKVFMINGSLKIYLNNFRKIKENRNEFYTYYNEILNKLRNIYLRSKYSIGDVLACHGLRILYNDSVWYASVYKDGEKYILSIPKSPYLRAVVKSKGYDLSGSLIFKVIIVSTEFALIHQVFLIGKEYTGQWWMHSLPPEYWNKSIAMCERWLLGLKKGDTIVRES
ncbi:MAG: hypothetical protein QXU79_04010 [Candidatus Micrarchaeaceae archaeon]